MSWFRDVPPHLPVSTGPYVPGCKDVMLGYGIDSLFMRLYYPTSSGKNLKDNSEKWIPWIMDYQYLVGVSKLLKISLPVLQVVSWWYGVSNPTKKSAVHIPILYGEKPNTTRKLKCIIMSHGMGGTRFFYSKICCDLASHGFLIIALEHRDSSCCYTYYYSDENEARVDRKTPIEYRHIPLGESHYNERNRQVQMRTEECNRIVELLKNLNDGIVSHNVLDEVPHYLSSDCVLHDFVGKLDLDDLIMMGHSFGAATALNTIAARREFKCGILLDPWMFPIKDEKLDQKIAKPILFVNTETFHVESNVKAMSKFLNINKNNEMFTLRGTTHEAQTDSVLIFGSWLNLFMKKIDAEMGLKITNSLILKFLHRQIEFPENVREEEKYLEEEKDKWLCGLTKAWS